MLYNYKYNIQKNIVEFVTERNICDGKENVCDGKDRDGKNKYSHPHGNKRRRKYIFLIKQLAKHLILSQE
jgi:hypothetical protein